MKKLVYALLIFILSSCTTLTPISYVKTLDYRPLIENGLFVTESNSVSFEYTSIGSLFAQETDGWINGQFVTPRIKNMYNNILLEAQRLGANGLINMSVKRLDHSIVIQGMFIKRVKYGDVKIIEERSVPIANDSLTGIKDDIRGGKINGTEYSVFRETENEICLSTSRRLTVSEMKGIKKELTASKKVLQFYILGIDNDNPYASLYETQLIEHRKGKITEFNE